MEEKEGKEWREQLKNRQGMAWVRRGAQATEVLFTSP